MLDSNRIATDYFMKDITNVIDYNNMKNNKKYDYEFVEKRRHTFPVGTSRLIFEKLGNEYGFYNLKFVSNDFYINSMHLLIQYIEFDKYNSKFLDNSEYPFQLLRDNIILSHLEKEIMIITNTNDEVIIEYDLVKIKPQQLELTNIFKQKQYCFLKATDLGLNKLELKFNLLSETFKITSEQELVNPYLSIDNNLEHFIYFNKLDKKSDELYYNYELQLDIPLNFNRLDRVDLCFNHNGTKEFNIYVCCENYNMYKYGTEYGGMYGLVYAQ